MNSNCKIKKMCSIVLMGVMLLSGCDTTNDQEILNQNLPNGGTYTASETGFGGDITVEVTLDDTGEIIDVKVDAESETESIGDNAALKIAEDIITSQSLGVDTVSGATVTSNAVLIAIEKALIEAGIDVDEWKSREVQKEGIDEEVNVDIIVVGAGGSGTSAALAAAEAGAEVMIIEKTSAVGGNTRLASGFFAVDSYLQREEGLELGVDEAVNRLLEFNAYLSNGPLTRAIVEKSADTIEWLESYGMDFYLQQETTQFAHEDDEYKYKVYHKYVDSTEGFNNIYEYLDEMGVEVRFNASLDSIIQDESGTVKGITAKKSDGGLLTINADATIICTGGFGANLEKVTEIMNTEYLTSIGMPNYGEGISLMEEAGAIDWDGTPLLHACQLAESEVTTESSSEALAGYSISSLTQLLMSPLLWVDSSGTRFVNEDVVYDTAFWSNAAYSVGGKYYFIVDTATLEDYTEGASIRVSNSGPGANMDLDDFVALAEVAVEGGTAYKGSTLEELAEAASMNVNDLKTSVERYNEIVKNQEDTDYNKSADSLVYTVEEGDYYAFECVTVFLGTIGGVKVNQRLEVIDIDYNPIQGLYAAGTDAGGYYQGKGYPPYEGLACGFAWTSGRIAGESAADYANNK
ncbi:fumarate reductase flavoprotein subunit [Natranaerovirga hydrolytica]|uniref:Urocanate reductase n=1 Tax=Natranaerovirga hydrolytica TaxID=680378 RepID=A0A4R1MZG0_9FIRM|nr:FAD-dependent oxidoreductase [Natranaerovirga hydrolytica]TCK98728.1 fumarate reductase flavoprotein subunit [Natranaerovirga hydrolytica]